MDGEAEEGGGHAGEEVLVARRVEAVVRSVVAAESVAPAQDFAHAAGDWPHSLEVIDETFVGVSTDERDRLLSRNAVDFFRLEEDA